MKQQKFAIDNDKVQPFITQEGAVVDKVPAGYYVVKENMFGYFLQNQSDELSLPSKIYGNAQSRSDRIWDTFDSKNAALAVGLFGSKGAGKTMLANIVAQQGIERGYPVIDVSASFQPTPDYLEFLNSIGNCVIIFDEFLKRLSKGGNPERSERQVSQERQDEMLTFFQGTHNSKRLVILIDNESRMLSEFFRDRPGRMRYNFNYSGITGDIVEQMASDAQMTETQTEMLVTYAKRFSCTFDTMNEIIYEWTRHPNETLEEITEIMNVPTLRPIVDRQGKIVSFDKGDTQYEMGNQLVRIRHDGDVIIQVNKPNPFFGAPEMTSDQFYDSELHSSNRHYDYEDFVKYRNNKYIPKSLVMHNSDLVGIRNGKSCYKDFGITVVIEELASTQVQSDLSYFSNLEYDIVV